ncbi:MAG: type II secretion system protein [Oceanisphaera sp.]|uniref:type II secretion system protein n=1 Tax=Oceanisphaera sp. TaxID=1929979 RepID=UPI003C770DAD
MANYLLPSTTAGEHHWLSPFPKQQASSFKQSAILAKQRGMTLLELLVVMVILAMVSALLVQGMGSALITYERVQRQQQQSMQPTLAYSWLAQTLSGAQAELDEPRQFSGTNNQFSGYTHRPLIGQSGQVSAFSWQLKVTKRNQLQLWYRQSKVNGHDILWQVLSWPAGSQGRFVYRTLEGGPSNHWPSLRAQQTLTVPAYQTKPDGRMPDILFMEITEPGASPQRWYISLPGRAFPRNDYRDF